MPLPAAARCLVAAIVAFAIVAIVFSGVLGGAASTGSNGQYVFVGLAALLAPLAGTVAGAWQARAAGTRRPPAGLALAGVVSLLLALWIFGTNETLDDTFNTLQPILGIVGVVLGAVLYGVRWFGATARI